MYVCRQPLQKMCLFSNLPHINKTYNNSFPNMDIPQHVTGLYTAEAEIKLIEDLAYFSPVGDIFHKFKKDQLTTESTFRYVWTLINPLYAFSSSTSFRRFGEFGTTVCAYSNIKSSQVKLIVNFFPLIMFSGLVNA